MRRPSSSIFVGRAQSGKLRKGDSAAPVSAVDYAPARAVPAWPHPPPTAVEAALGQFQQYLRQERSLSEATVINYTPVARSFLSERFPKGAVTLPTDHRGRHHRVRAAAGHAGHVQTRAAGGDCAAVLSALLVPSRHRGCRLGDVRSHHRHMVALQCAKVSCRRADPEDPGFV